MQDRNDGSKNRTPAFRMAGRFEFNDRRAAETLALTDAETAERVEWITRCIKGQASDFQVFLAHYFGRGAFWERFRPAQKLARLVFHRSIQWEHSVNRFALSVGLVVKFCPRGGRWFDAGSLGHDALKVKIERPDIEMSLASYEGCIVYLDGTGLHYHGGGGPPPEPHVLCRQLDLERQTLEFADGSVDLVTSFETLEHYKASPQHFMLEVNRVLKPGARLVLTTPNGVSAAAINRILHGEHPAENPHYHRVAEYGRVHPLEYTLEQLRDLVTLHGFEIELLASMNLTPFSDDEWAAISAARGAKSLLLGKHPGEFGEKWLLIARKTQSVSEPRYPSSLFE